MGRSVAAAIAAVLVLGACTNDPPADGFEGLPEATESPTAVPSPGASAEAAGEIDVTTTPDEITPAWVTAVVNTLLAEYGEMTAEILAMPVADDPTLPDGFEERLDELFDGEYLERRTSELLELHTEPSAREELRPADEFGGLRFDTQLVQHSEPSCVVAVGRISHRLTLPDGGPAAQLSAISLGVGGTDATDANPTEWVLVDELLNVDQNNRALDDEVMLNASVEDYGSSLEHTCGDVS